MERFNNTTRGEFYVDKNVGCGSDTHAVCMRGTSDKIFIAMRKPKRYYTDYPPSSDGEGVILSTEAAMRAGNYVATKEIKDEINQVERENAEFIAYCMNLNQTFDITKLEECVKMLIDIRHHGDSIILKLNTAKMENLINEVIRGGYYQQKKQ